MRKAQTGVADARVCGAAWGRSWARDTGPSAVLPQASRICIQTRPASPGSRAGLSRPIRPNYQAAPRQPSAREFQDCITTGVLYAPRRGCLSALPRAFPVAFLFCALRLPFAKRRPQQPRLRLTRFEMRLRGVLRTAPGGQGKPAGELLRCGSSDFFDGRKTGETRASPPGLSTAAPCGGLTSPRRGCWQPLNSGNV